MDLCIQCKLLPALEMHGHLQLREAGWEQLKEKEVWARLEAALEGFVRS